MEELAGLLREGGVTALPLSFLAGIVASANPCCLPIYPAATGCCAALRRKGLGANLLLSASFVLGGSIATTTLGVASALAGRVFTALGSWPAYLVAAVPIVFGLHLLGALPLPSWPASSGSRAVSGLSGAAIGGALLGLTIAPCATPVLAGLLAYVATTGDPIWGAMLLFVYGVGLGIPILFFGTTAASLLGRFSSERARRLINHTVALLLLAMGLYLIWLV